MAAQLHRAEAKQPAEPEGQLLPAQSLLAYAAFTQADSKLCWENLHYDIDKHSA